jgi:hypothetical protein
MPAAALAAVLLAVACGSDGQPSGSAPGGPSAEPATGPAATPLFGLDSSINVPSWEPETAMDVVMAGMLPDGEVPLDAALAAFSLVFGPLPDVPTPPSGPTLMGAGEHVVQAVINHWADLTAEQRAAVEAYLRPGSAASAGGIVAAAYRPDASTPTVIPSSTEADARAAVEAAKVEVGRRLGRTLTLPITVAFGLEGSAWMWAETHATTADGSVASTGQAAGCQIGFSTALGGLTAGADLDAIAAHEVFHCFQYSLPPLEVALAVPGWLAEGAGAWVGEEVSGGSNTVGGYYWGRWLYAPFLPLFARYYDGLGFFAHASEHGVDVWGVLDEMHRAGSSSIDAYLKVAEAPTGDEMIDAWGPSYFRNPSLGNVWNMQGPGLPYEVPTKVTEVTIGNGDGTAFAAHFESGWPIGIILSADVLVLKAVLPDVSARGRIRFSDDNEYLLSEIVGTPICTLPGGCACPSGSKGADHSFKPGSTGPTLFGLTGHTDLVPVEVVGYERDSFCSEVRPSDLKPDAPCLCPHTGSLTPMDRRWT